MRREAIPPLRGGAVQALPNFQTTLGDHPHPASRPMTSGHFTSWRADDRGYYTGVDYTPAFAPHGGFVLNAFLTLPLKWDRISGCSQASSNGRIKDLPTDRH